MRVLALNHSRGLWPALLGLAVLCALGGCVNSTVKSSNVPALQTPLASAPEEELLDVGVAVFDAGLDAADDKEPVYPEVRRAEARYIPRLLSEVLQNSGAWGAVRVVPDEARIADLLVTGTILHSDGELLKLHVIARDSRRYIWLDKTYEERASRYAYDARTRSQYDPFQAIYHRIANDLLRHLDALASAQRREIRSVSELLFAQSFSAQAFEGYLDTNRSGRLVVARLPAQDDPMLARVRKLRERDHVFVDTLQGYYGDFSETMYGPYQEWRKLSYDEVVAYRELKRQSNRQLIAGGAAILAGIAAAGGGDGATRAAGRVAIMGGGYLLKSGLDTRAEAKIHVEALEEVGQSLETEITPRVIELEDRTVTISGSVEDQYAQWREVLAEIYRREIGAAAPLDADSADRADPGTARRESAP